MGILLGSAISDGRVQVESRGWEKGMIVVNTVYDNTWTMY